MSEPRAARRRGRGGSEARRAARSQRTVTHLPYITRNLPLTEVLTGEGLDIIENNAETILAEIGIEFRSDDEALALWKDAGADIDGERVRLSRGLARSLLKTAPESFTQHAHNPERSVLIGGDCTVFAPIYGPPFVREVGPGAHYLGCAHTQANFETAFYRSTIADNNSFEQWEDEGSRDAYQRANQLYTRLLA